MASLAIALLVAATQQASWPAVDSVRMVGVERFGDGKEHPLAALVTPGARLFGTGRAVEGRLGGIPRIELEDKRGLFTWLESQTTWVLPLFRASSADLALAVTPTRISPAALSEGADAVGKVLNANVKELPPEKILERDCYVLEIERNGDPMLHRVWIDKGTGLVLRQDDKLRGKPSYSRVWEVFELKPSFHQANIALPAEAKVLKGAPHPEILLKVQAARTEKDLAADIARVKKAVRVAEGKWIRTPRMPAGFDYAHTVHLESSSTVKPPKRNPASGPELVPGGLPNGWSMSGNVQTDGTIFFDFKTPSGGGPKVRIPAPGDHGKGSTFQIWVGDDTVAMVAYYDKDGSLVIAPGKSPEEGELARSAENERITGAGAWVQSDFVDRKTGDTVSFIQLRNRDAAVLLRGLKLPEPKSLPRIPGGRAYELQGEHPMQIVEWLSGGTRYLLVSSRLSVNDLVSLSRE